MMNTKRYTALRLEWGHVAQCVGNLMSAILGRQILCSVRIEDESYWSISLTNSTFSNSEIMRLIEYVDGDSTMIRLNIPLDSNFSRSLDMGLCQALLQKILKSVWEQELVTETDFWIIGNFPESLQLPDSDRNILYIDNKIVDCSELLSKEAFLKELFDRGGTFSDLVQICEAYDLKTGTPLYWSYPITDGKHSGCYFVLVQEGVLTLGYDSMDPVDHEIFDPDSAKLCNAEELAWFLDDWNHYSDRLKANLNALLFYQERREA